MSTFLTCSVAFTLVLLTVWKSFVFEFNFLLQSQPTREEVNLNASKVNSSGARGIDGEQAGVQAPAHAVFIVCSGSTSQNFMAKINTCTSELL